MKTSPQTQIRSAFSLVEVVLAIGVLSLAIVALLGLFGPTIGSVKQVIDTNLATAAVSRINTEIQRGFDNDPAKSSWDEVLEATSASGSVFFVWKSQEAPSSGQEPKPVEFKFSSDPQEVIDDLNAGYLVDTPMAVTFERGMQTGTNAYDFSNVGNEGYFPILISIYPIEPTQASTYTKVDNLKNTLDPIFTYTTAKTRSL